jgi:hypothetical protein
MFWTLPGCHSGDARVWCLEANHVLALVGKKSREAHWMGS